MLTDSLNKVINHFGSTTQVARALGIKQQSVSDWHRGRSKVPLEMALHLDFLMRGEVGWEELVAFEIAYRLKDLRLSLKEAGIYPCELIHVLVSRIQLPAALAKNQTGYIHRPPCINEDYTLIFGVNAVHRYQRKNKKTIPCWKLSLEKLAEGEYLTEYLTKSFLISELAAIGIAVEDFLGDRRGQRTDLVKQPLKDDAKQLRENFPQVNIKQGIKTRDFVATLLGFNNSKTYEHAKKVLLSGEFTLIEQMDQKKLAISRAAHLAKLSLVNKSKQD